MQITLKQLVEEENNGQKKIVEQENTYEVPYVSSSAFLEYLEIEAEKEDPTLVKVDDAKKIVKLIVKTYENQFTEEEFFKGVPGYKLMDVIDEFITSLNTDPYANLHPEVTEEAGNAEKKAV